jgi:hypothetical protein
MRKPLTDSLCAELAKDFKPFKVRLNPLKPKNGFKTSTTYVVTELRKNGINQWVIRFKRSKFDWLAENFDMIVEKQAEPKRIDELKPKKMISGFTDKGHWVYGKLNKIDDDGFTWIDSIWGLTKLVAVEVDPIQVKAQQIDDKLKAIDTDKVQKPITSFGRLRVGNVVRGYLPCDGVTIIGEIQSFNGINPVVYGITIDYSECEIYNEDVEAVNKLVQYVSEHRNSMSKESLMHFANLIGLIKLGAL